MELDPHQGSAQDLLGGLQRPQTPSCIGQWPAVIAYRAHRTMGSNKEQQEVRAHEKGTLTCVTMWILQKNGVNTWIKAAMGGGGGGALESSISFMSWWSWQLSFFLERHSEEFHDVNSISYPTESLILI